MRNSKLIKLLCLILSIFMAVSLLGACSDKEGANSSEPSVSSDPSSNNDDNSGDDNQAGDDTADNNTDEFDQPSDGDDNSGDNWENNEPSEGDDEGDDDDEGVPYSESLHVFNAEAPIISNYRGMSSTVYHAYGHMLDDKTGRAYNQEMLDLELNRLQNAGVHYARTRYTTEWAWDARTGGWNWDSTRMKYYWTYCKNLQDRNIEVLQQVGWHLGVVMKGDKGQPTSITEHNYIKAANSYTDKYGESASYDFSQCPDSNYRYYAKSSLRLAEAHAQLLLEAKKRGINNITHLMYFTEPSYASTEYPAPETYIGKAADEYIFIVRTIQGKLKERGVYDMVKHVGPNFSCKQSNATNYGGLARYILDKGNEDLFDIWTSHFYAQRGEAFDNYYDVIHPTFEGYLKPMKDHGLYGKKEFWVDEFYCRSDNALLGVDSPWAGLQMAVGGIIAQQSGISNISTWQIFDQLWTDQSNTGGEFNNGIHVCGSAPSLFVSSIPKSQYYTTQLFAKYHGYENGKTFRTNNDALREVTSSDISIGAVQLADGSWTITVVNASLDDYEVTVEFDKAIYQTLYRHVSEVTKIVCTTAAHLADADKTFADVKDKFIDVVPAASVAIYTGIKG
ncbi:MAG: hypothetical protein IJD71_03875 [Clostridia bacterium]|nr:hypothetical protein [Clostridia bacterium]MBQ9919858.1 hypothetical protein [Clostridia bacterium]